MSIKTKIVGLFISHSGYNYHSQFGTKKYYYDISGRVIKRKPPQIHNREIFVLPVGYRKTYPEHYKSLHMLSKIAFLNYFGQNPKTFFYKRLTKEKYFYKDENGNYNE